ncbi:hypothetical protein AB1Y20_018345 [Prymnesium parvum]|uniref:Protein kinase domain-containing protein n=1 Tax=Prymnesium parvum TaxID=97485 RepID=A0AB34JRE3_PRYPA
MLSSIFETREQKARGMLSAAEKGDERQLRRLLRSNSNLVAKDKYGYSPLHWAAYNGHEGAVRLLLEKNADLEATDWAGNSPLHLAAFHGHEGAVRLLLEKKADIAARGEYCRSPLHWAARYGHEGVVRLLLQTNADTAARDEEGASPLHWAASNGHEGAVRLLLEKTADLAARNKEGRTALDEAVSQGHSAVVALLKHIPASTSRPQQAPVGQGGITQAVAQLSPRPPAATLQPAEKDSPVGGELARKREGSEAAEQEAHRGDDLSRERGAREAAEREAFRVSEELARTRQQLDALLQAQQRSIAVVSMAELRSFTDSFSAANKIGQGGFGSVFRTHQPLPSLPHSGLCAVKRLDAGSMQGHAEVHSEIRVLSACWHEHLLPLVGFCLDEATPCLVYPLMAGSLESRVVDPPQGQQRFSWQERVRAVRDATRALVYLHTPLPAKNVVLHRDVKPSNILLDAQGNAKLADVGLAREAPELQGGVTHLTTKNVIGTPGFIDPLYTQSGRFSELTDGYAMGVTLLVCLGGRSAIEVVDRFGDALERVASAANFTDPAAEWPLEVAEQALEIVRGLMWGRTPSRRTTLQEALSRLERMADAQGLRPGITDAINYS